MIHNITLIIVILFHIMMVIFWGIMYWNCMRDKMPWHATAAWIMLTYMGCMLGINLARSYVHFSAL